MFYVYKITNIKNNKIYIGKTNNVAKRLAKHLSAAKHKRENDYHYFHKAINKYGKENFILETIATYNSEKESLQAEIDFIKKYNSTDRNIGYNLSAGGDSPLSGRKHDQATLEKMSKANKGKTVSQETRDAISKTLTGIKRSKETREKLKAVIANNPRRNYLSKLNEDNVLEIRKLYMEGINKQQLSQQFNITIYTINDIISRRSWKHL